MKFQVLSDIHIETLNEIPDYSCYLERAADVLILAGDIGRIHRYEQLKGFLSQVCKQFSIVLYVLGNHEYYTVDGIDVKSMAELEAKVSNLSQELQNLYILNRSSVIIEDVCIAGCTLWTTAMIDLPKYIVKIPELTTKTYNDMHYRDVKYIESMIDYCQKNRLKLLMVTHHCPTYAIPMTKYKRNSPYHSLYCNNLDRLLDRLKVHTWICGHTHNNFDLKTRNQTRLLSNQRGKYEDHIEDFSRSKVIHV